MQVFKEGSYVIIMSLGAVDCSMRVCLWLCIMTKTSPHVDKGKSGNCLDHNQVEAIYWPGLSGCGPICGCF